MPALRTVAPKRSTPARSTPAKTKALTTAPTAPTVPQAAAKPGVSAPPVAPRKPVTAPVPAPKAPAVAAPTIAAAKPAPKAPSRAVVQARAKTEKPAKTKKEKMVRDSFTIPKGEYAVLEQLKQRSGKLGGRAKKSELLRAGIKALAAMQDAAFTAALAQVPTIKTGRPLKG